MHAAVVCGRGLVHAIHTQIHLVPDANGRALETNESLVDDILTAGITHNLTGGQMSDGDK